MKSRNVADFCKNAVGTVFLLAGAFFVCSTLVSMRAVFADPVAPVYDAVQMTAQSPRAAASSRASSRTASPRGNAAPATVARTTSAAPTTTTSSRSVSARGNASRAATNVRTTTAAPSATSSRAVSSRTVVSRTATAPVSSRATSARSVTARTAAASPNSRSRVSLTGSAIRGSKASTSTYTYLSNKLYTGNYSNIIDSTTGLISADAYNNCMESYYTCMDEICTARSASQGRCACAGRIKSFAAAETALEQANEELIKVSGELALLIANKGKDVSQAFQLTDAEKVMNCVSWQEVTGRYGISSKEAIEWCTNHSIYGKDGAELTSCAKPVYCSTDGNNFGFDVSKIDGDSSDILAQLVSYSKARDEAITDLYKNNDNLKDSFDNISNIVSNLAGINVSQLTQDDISKDKLANTWGYDLFVYAHNNVCNRVLDSCFNGIYESCGAPSGGRKCANGASQCPFNFNSTISTNTATNDLNFVQGTSGGSASTNPSCYGYSSSSTDPYANLRGPVADARRSILQKYALDANAACDVYGEQLRATAQNVSYQKVAAAQALQQKRLEFANDEIAQISSDYKAAISNFNECLAELYDCYNTQEESNKNWSTSRIKSYCSQVSNAPHCYEPMICGAPNSSLQAVIDKTDDATKACSNTTDFSTNTCRNLITISEILSGSYAAGAAQGSSVQMREACLQRNGIEGVRDWARSSSDTNVGWSVDDGDCPEGYHSVNGGCQSNTRTCTIVGDANAIGQQTWDTAAKKWSVCTINSCVANYHKDNDKCVSNIQKCEYDADPNAYRGQQTWIASINGWSACALVECKSGYQIINGVCKAINSES